MTSLQRTSLRNKIKQFIHNQPRSRTQENYCDSINLIYFHTDFLKPLLNYTNQRLHKNQKQRNYSFFPRTLLTSVSSYTRKPKQTSGYGFAKLSSFLALYYVQLNALIQFSQVYTLYNSQKL